MNTSETYNLNIQEKMLNHLFHTIQLTTHPNSFYLLIICELNAKQLLFNFCRVVSDRANALTLKILHMHELQA